MPTRRSWAILATVALSYSFPMPAIASAAHLPPSIVPRPAKMEIAGGTFTIDAKTTIMVSPGDTGLSGVAQLLAGQLRTATGFPLPMSVGKISAGFRNAILISRDAQKPSGGPEGYRLTVSPAIIRISAQSPAGAFYAMQTLFQLLPPEFDYGTPVVGVAWEVPCLTIEDAPRFSWRGMHLDSGRHFAPVWFVKKYIDLIARYKFNTFHWHLTEDQGWRIQIRKYPNLTAVGSWRKETLGDGIPHGGFYTQDEIREVVEYARQRSVTIVPEFEMPGHSMAALASYPELSCTGGPFQVQSQWGVFDDVFCAGNDQTFDFLEDVLTEVMELFPGSFIHIGGDECPKTRWKVCPRCQARMAAEGLKTEHELQSYFIKRIEKFLGAHGRRLIGWDEILEGGLAPNASVMSWRGIQGGIDAAKAGHDVVMTPTSHCYFDYYQALTGEPLVIGEVLSLEKVYSYEPVPATLTAAEAKHILGAQGNVWSEAIPLPAVVEYMAFPRACALSEVVWSPAPLRDFKDFSARMASHYERLLNRGVNVRIPSPTGFDGLVLFLHDTLASVTNPVPGAIVRWTADGTEPTAASPMTDGPVRVDRSMTLRARTFLRNGAMSPVASGYMNLVDPAVNGVRYTVYNGIPADLKECEKLPVLDSGSRLRISLEGIPLTKDSSIVALSGSFSAPKEGVYTFWLSADQNAFLEMDGATVAMDTTARWWIQTPGRVALRTGEHPFRLLYVRQTRRAGLNLQVEGPGLERQAVPPSMLRRDH
jgi:hexosaminidase